MTSVAPPTLSLSELASKHKIFLVGSTLWTVLVLCLLWSGVGPALRQLRTLQYDQTSGMVTDSEIKQDSDSYAFFVTYVYSVGGTTYKGHVLKNDELRSNQRNHFEALHARFGEGKTVPVYFDPRSPQLAVLIRGELDLTVFVFVMMVVAPAVSAWGVAWEQIRLRCFVVEAAGFPVTHLSGRRRVFLAEHRAAAVGVLWCGSCLVIMLFGFLALGFHSPHTWILLVLQLAAAPLLCLLQRWLETWLELDEYAQMLRVIEAGKVFAECPYDAMRRLWVRERRYRDSEGDHQTKLILTLEHSRAGERQGVALHSSEDRERLDAFRDWLAEQLPRRLPASEPQPRAADELDLPRVWRVQRGGVSDWIALAFQSLIVLAGLYFGARFVVYLFTPDSQRAPLWLLVFAAMGLLAARSWLRRIDAIRRRDASLVYVDALGIGWEDAFRGEGLPSRSEASKTGGYVALTRITKVIYGCGPGANEIDLHLKGGQICTLPLRVTREDYRHELVELLAEGFPDVTLVECESCQARK